MEMKMNVFAVFVAATYPLQMAMAETATCASKDLKGAMCTTVTDKSQCENHYFVLPPKRGFKCRMSGGNCVAGPWDSSCPPPWAVGCDYKTASGGTKVPWIDAKTDGAKSFDQNADERNTFTAGTSATLVDRKRCNEASSGCTAQTRLLTGSDSAYANNKATSLDWPGIVGIPQPGYGGFKGLPVFLEGYTALRPPRGTNQPEGTTITIKGLKGGSLAICWMSGHCQGTWVPRSGGPGAPPCDGSGKSGCEKMDPLGFKIPVGTSAEEWDPARSTNTVWISNSGSPYSCAVKEVTDGEFQFPNCRDGSPFVLYKLSDQCSP